MLPLIISLMNNNNNNNNNNSADNVVCPAVSDDYRMMCVASINSVHLVARVTGLCQSVLSARGLGRTVEWTASLATATVNRRVGRLLKHKQQLYSIDPALRPIKRVFCAVIRSPVVWTVDLMFCACFLFFFSQLTFSDICKPKFSKLFHLTWLCSKKKRCYADFLIVPPDWAVLTAGVPIQ